MKKLIFLALIAAAAWYGWKNWPTLFEKRDGHEVVVENGGTADLERVRVEVDGQTLVREVVATGGRSAIPFKVNNDATFVVTWQWKGRIGEFNWRGGSVPKGPMLQRHHIQITDDNEVIYRPENK